MSEYREITRTIKYKPTYEITGTWSGYTSSQSRVVHREFTKDKKFVDKVEKLGGIRYTDGTFLWLKVREMGYRERKEPKILSYTSLIRKCFKKETTSVADLD